MTYHISWDNAEKTVCHLELSERWTWEEWTKGYKETYAMLGQVPHRVTLICSIQGNIPTGNAIPHIKFVATNQPPNLQYTIIVNQVGAFFQELLNALHHQMGWNGLDLVTTYDEAYQLIHQR